MNNLISMKQAIATAVERALYEDHLERVAKDNKGVFSLSINVKVNIHEEVVEAKVTGAIKLVSDGKASLPNPKQMLLNLGITRMTVRECEECGCSIEGSPAHFRLCEDCFKEGNS